MPSWSDGRGLPPLTCIATGPGMGESGLETSVSAASSASDTPSIGDEGICLSPLDLFTTETNEADLGSLNAGTERVCLLLRIASTFSAGPLPTGLESVGPASLATEAERGESAS